MHSWITSVRKYIYICIYIYRLIYWSSIAWRVQTCRFITSCISIYCLIKILCNNDAIWRHRSEWTLAQVKACCLTAASHYLNHCVLIMKCGIHLRAISQDVPINLIFLMCFEIKKNLPSLPGTNTLTLFPSQLVQLQVQTIRDGWSARDGERTHGTATAYTFLDHTWKSAKVFCSWLYTLNDNSFQIYSVLVMLFWSNSMASIQMVCLGNSKKKFEIKKIWCKQ